MATILVADDNQTSQRMLQYVLEKLGHQVVCTGDGEEALARLADTAADLVILDLAMPRMDGLTTLRYLRADEHYRTLPIVMLTASGLEKDERQARADGVSEFLTKPYRSRELIEKIERLLG